MSVEEVGVPGAVIELEPEPGAGALGFELEMIFDEDTSASMIMRTRDSQTGQL